METGSGHGAERSGRDSSCSSYSLGSRQDDLNSSVAVIPPMQICPGDLLVYSRVLAHKASGYGELEIDLPPLKFPICYLAYSLFLIYILQHHTSKQDEKS